MTPVQVRMARAALDLTIEDLSKEAGLKPDDLQQLEHGGSEGAASAKLRGDIRSFRDLFSRDRRGTFRREPP